MYILQLIHANHPLFYSFRLPSASETKLLTAIDDDFEGLQPGDNAKITIATTITQPPNQQQPSSSLAKNEPKPGAAGPQPEQGHFARSYEQFLEKTPAERRSHPAFDDEDDDDDDEMVAVFQFEFYPS